MSQTADGVLMAVVRANCSIEIWLKHSWSQITVIPGNTNCPIRNVHWLEAPSKQKAGENPLYSAGKKRRLFTTGVNGAIIEWDILSGDIKSRFSA